MYDLKWKYLAEIYDDIIFMVFTFLFIADVHGVGGAVNFYYILL